MQDQGILADCENTVQSSIDGLGGLDIIVSNAGWTKFTEFGDLDALSEEEWDKCFAVNCKGNLHLLRKALPTFNANPEGGVFLMTSSIAGIGPQGSTMGRYISQFFYLTSPRRRPLPGSRVVRTCPSSEHLPKEEMLMPKPI
ncbi:MAG: hypothetical protein Q9184_003505 [Pyrenodesmia sp. 2 TL-2023]